MRCTSLDVTLGSLGDLIIDALEADEIRVRSSSAGDIDIAQGDVERQDIRLDSTGDYRAWGLESQQADVELTSAGAATVRVRDCLTARLTSSGNLLHVGRPQVDQTVRSSGKVVRQGE